MSRPIEAREITRQRLLNQHVAKPKLTTAQEIVFELGAVQSQDFSMGKWAIGVRLKGATDAAVQEAIATGEVIRMHLLRPTWHFVARKDARWILDLTGPNIRASMKYRDKQLELTDDAVRKSNRTVAKALRAGPVTRDDLVSALEAAGMSNYDNRAAHLLMRAELDRVACSAPPLDGKQAYVLFDAWIPPAASLTREEALAELARRYFRTRCPVTMRDFTWWSGLSVKDARAALETLKSSFTVEKVGSQVWVMCMSSRRTAGSDVDGKSVGLLPAFDEMVLSYADRSALFGARRSLQSVVSGGIIKPIIVSGGQVIGTWNRQADENKVTVTVSPFGTLAAAARDSIEKAAGRYAAFLGKPLEILTRRR
ncbi:MAG TPA: winged helix DNA-binding domain-containing protein [Spirochaetia bacterium]|nr:winged helix DNA-binding domain-containing protein [Spirochaetia bacterium]